MASFNCYIPTNLFGKGSPPEFDLYYADGSVFELDFPEFYELFGGTFTYSSDGTPNGVVTAIGVYDYDNIATQFWDAEGGIYDAATIFDVVDTGTWREFFEYILALDDEIFGSSGNDKLDGYQGDDYVDGYSGNDKLKGGPGFDVFYFQRFDGRDTIKDFSLKKDTIMLDNSLASNKGDVFTMADAYKNGVVLNFGSEEIKVQGLKLSKLSKVDFDFVT